MTCGCITDIDAKLPKHRLDTCIVWLGNNLVSRTATPLLRRDNGRKEARSNEPSIFKHNFCPFCGVEYDADAKAQQP